MHIKMEVRVLLPCTDSQYNLRNHNHGDGPMEYMQKHFFMLQTYFSLFPSRGHGSHTSRKRREWPCRLHFFGSVNVWELTNWPFKKSSRLATDTVQMKEHCMRWKGVLGEIWEEEVPCGLSRYSESAVFYIQMHLNLSKCLFLKF